MPSRRGSRRRVAPAPHRSSRRPRTPAPPSAAGTRCRRADAPDSRPGVTPTTMPALALRSLREYWLMPLVTSRPGSDAAATTVPPGTHAEAVDRAAVAGVMHQLVVGRTEPRMPGAVGVAAPVDQRLRMLDADADRERLRLHGDAAIVEHLEGVARAVPDRQHDMLGRDVRAVGQHHAAHLPAAVRPYVDDEVRHLALEAILAAERLDGLRACSPRSSPAGRCRYAAWRRRGFRAARRP